MDNILKFRVLDAIDICEKTVKPQFIGFLRPEEIAFAEPFLKNRVEYCFFGGYNGSARAVLGVFPPHIDPEKVVFPIAAITLSYRLQDNLTHRDFLGSLLALGIKRETIGDILIENGRAVVFLLNDILKYVLTQIERIGRVGVKVQSGFEYPLPEIPEKFSKSTTVASDRLDCIVAALANTSRADAAKLISDSRVAVNSVPAVKSTKNVAGGDVITIRGFGKFAVASLGGSTKKGRMILNYEKY